MGKLFLQWQGLIISALTWSLLPVTLIYFLGSKQTYFKRELYSRRFPELRVLFTFGEFPGSGHVTVDSSMHVGHGEGYWNSPSEPHLTFTPFTDCQSVSVSKAIPLLHGYHVWLFRLLRFPSHVKFRFVPAGLSVRLSQNLRWHSNTAGGSVYSVFHWQVLSRLSFGQPWPSVAFLILYRRSRHAHLRNSWLNLTSLFFLHQTPIFLISFFTQSHIAVVSDSFIGITVIYHEYRASSPRFSSVFYLVLVLLMQDWNTATVSLIRWYYNRIRGGSTPPSQNPNPMFLYLISLLS